MYSVTQTNLGGGGRLGNMLFGCATIYGTAYKLGLKPQMPLWSYAKYFDKQFVFCDDEVTHVFDEPYFHYTSVDLAQAVEVRSGEPKVLDLRGYFQSPLYWQGYENEIKDLFKLTPEFETEIDYLRKAFGLKGLPGERCSIHIRRGDYVNNCFYTDLTATNYYEDAIKFVKQHTNTSKFLIFSDDISFCREFLRDREDCIFVDGNSDIEDLFLMSKCTHNICANSSFSWWSAYLNSHIDKVIIAPEKWFGASVNFNIKDLIPVEWVRL